MEECAQADSDVMKQLPGRTRPRWQQQLICDWLGIGGDGGVATHLVADHVDRWVACRTSPDPDPASIAQ